MGTTENTTDNLVHLTIDGLEACVPKGTTILKAARTVGIDIPALCYVDCLPPDGSCRLCMVEVEGWRKLQISCACEVEEGIVVHTNSDRITAHRKFVLDLLMSDHREHCFSCAQNGRCKLQNYCMDYGVPVHSYEDYKIRQTKMKIDTSSPYFSYDPNLCIMCRRCQRTCESLTGKNIISLHQRGFDTRMGIPYGHDWRESPCGICGSCVEVCPVGALFTKSAEKKYRIWEVKKTQTTCTLCGKGCSVELYTKNNAVQELVSDGGLDNVNSLPCSRGRYTYWETLKDRVTTPLIKDKATGEFEEASWEDAMALIKENLGEDAIVFGSDSTTDEEIGSAREIAALTGSKYETYAGYAQLMPLLHGVKSVLINDADMVSGCRSARYCSYCQLYCDKVSMLPLIETPFAAVICPAMSDAAKAADVVLPGYAFSELSGKFHDKDVVPAVKPEYANGLTELLNFVK